MVDFTTLYGISKPTYDGDADLWGTELNTGAEVIDAALGVVGSSLVLNGKISITAASIAGTFTADLVKTKTAIGGKTYLLSAYSQAIALNTTGAGGMDTGTAPVSGYLAIYAINKADGTASILCCNVTASSGEFYTGANMPADYVASALLGIVPTNGSSQFSVCHLIGRKVFVPITATVSATADGGTHSFAVPVPPSAKAADLGLAINKNTSTSIALVVTSTSTAASPGYAAAGVDGASGNLRAFSPATMPLITAQTLFYTGTSGATVTITTTGYTF